MNRLDVWITFTRGNASIANAILTTEKVADIIAWLAIVAAKVEMTNIGQKTTAVANKYSEVRQEKDYLDKCRC